MGRVRRRLLLITIAATVMILFGGTVLVEAVTPSAADVVILIDNDASMDMTYVPNLLACPCLNPDHYYINPQDASRNRRFTTSFPDDGSEIWRYHYNSNEILISVLDRDKQGNFQCEAANEQKGCYDRRILGRNAAIDIIQNLLSYNTKNRVAYLPFFDQKHEVEFTSDMEIITAALEATETTQNTGEARALQKAYALLDKRTPEEKQERAAHIIVITGGGKETSTKQQQLLSVSDSLFQRLIEKKRSLFDRISLHTIDLSDGEKVITAVKKKSQAIYHTGSDRQAIHRSAAKIVASILSGDTP